MSTFTTQTSAAQVNNHQGLFSLLTGYPVEQASEQEFLAAIEKQHQNEKRSRSMDNLRQQFLGQFRSLNHPVNFC